MSAVQDPAGERPRANPGGLPRPWSRACPLLREPLPLIGYVIGVLASYLAITGWCAASTPVTDGDVTLFAALVSCGSSAGTAARSSRSCSTAPRRRRPALSPSGSAAAPAWYHPWLVTG